MGYPSMRPVWMFLAVAVVPAVTAGEPGQRLKSLGTLEGARPTPFHSRIALSPDGKILATIQEPAIQVEGKPPASSTAEGIQLWDVTKRKIRTTLRHPGATSVAFSPDGKMLASGGNAVEVKLWDVATGKKKAALREGTFVSLPFVPLAFSPDGKTLVCGTVSEDGSRVEIKFWDVATGKVKATLHNPGPIMAVAFSPDSKTLTTGTGQFASNGQAGRGAVQLWEVATGRQRATFKGGFKVKFRDPSFAALRESEVPEPVLKRLAALKGKEFRTEKDFDRELDRVVAPIRDKNKRGETFGLVVSEARPWYTGPFVVWSAAFSPDGKTLACSDVYGSILLWDLKSGRQKAALQTFDPEEMREEDLNPCWSVAFSPDGKLLAAGTMRGLKFWDVRSGKAAAGLKGPPAAVWSVAFSRDGKTLATAEGKLATRFRDLQAPTIRLWELVPARKADR